MGAPLARARRGSTLALFAVFAVACSGAQSTTASRSPSARLARPFEYVALDGRHFDSETTHGRATIVTLITTYDLNSQVVAERVARTLETHRPRINAGAVVLEPPQNAVLVEAFARALGITYPVALADPPTLEARGAFGDVRVVPTTVVLDANGAEAWRKEGVMTELDLSNAVDAALR